MVPFKVKAKTILIHFFLHIFLGTTNETKLSPKDLIDRYQLDKSHIAFTLCTKLPNGTYDIHPETTIISTVLSELSSKPSTASKKQSGNDLLELLVLIIYFIL